LLTGVLIAVTQAGQAADEIVLVANPDVGVTTLSVDAVKAICTGKTANWNNGAAVVLAVLDGGVTHEAFVRTYAGKTPSQFAVFWKKQAFTGKGFEPKAFASESELLKYVAATKGAIGYVSAAAAGDLAGCQKVEIK